MRFFFALNVPLPVRGSVVPAKFIASGIYVIELPDAEIISVGAETLPRCGSIVPDVPPFVHRWLSWNKIWRLPTTWRNELARE